MDYKKMRKPFFHVSKYQRPIIILSVLPVILVCCLFTLMMLFFSAEIAKVIIDGSTANAGELILRWVIVVLLGLWIIFVLILAWVYKSSSNLVGAFERIIRELTEINEGRRSGPIKVRDKDILANDLMTQVNKLIARMESSGN